MTDIMDKILPGYFYHISGGGGEGDRTISMYTGSGGARLYIETCRKNNIPDQEIGAHIFVYTDDWGRVCLNDLKVKDQDGQPSGSKG